MYLVVRTNKKFWQIESKFTLLYTSAKTIYLDMMTYKFQEYIKNILIVSHFLVWHLNFIGFFTHENKNFQPH